VNPKSLKNWIFFFAALLFSVCIHAKGLALEAIALADLPGDARATLVLIQQGGPFPYAKDGAIFSNYEKVLPKKQRGYYREFTVKTPGIRNRGTRRIIVGGEPASSRERYYTDDHYATFRLIKE
jgi:ribonuclease T1